MVLLNPKVQVVEHHCTIFMLLQITWVVLAADTILLTRRTGSMILGMHSMIRRIEKSIQNQRLKLPQRLIYCFIIASRLMTHRIR